MAPGECLSADEFAGLFEELATEFEGFTEEDLRAGLEELGLELCEPVDETEGEEETPTPVKPVASAPRPFTYANCDEARAHGAAPVHAGQYGYGPHLDRDSDGIGCEETTALVTQPVAHTGAGKLAYTGVSVQPVVAWGAVLLVSGGALIHSARRRA